MTPERCPDAEQLRRLLGDQLQGPEAQVVEAHVEVCPGCQQALEQLTAAAGRQAGPRGESGAAFLRRLQDDPPTAAWPASPTTISQGEMMGRAKLAPVARIAQAEDVPTLLRKRLLFLSVLNLAIVAAYAITFLPQYPNPVSVSLYAGLLALNATLAAVLRSRRPLSLPALRWLEVVLFGCLAIYFSFVQFRLLSQGWVGRAARYDWEGMFLLARGLNSLWFALLIGYGLLIPNTWRRAAGVVGAMALCPVLLNTAMALREADVERRLTILFVAESAINMGIGAALAIYGSHRIEVLRRQASEVRKLGQYELKQRLGAGGMGEVWLAEHMLLRRPCAVKLIRAERLGDRQTQARFEREVRATATLSHPNTVEIYDYGHAEDGIFYYAMEYLPGLTLRELVAKDGPLPPERAVHLLRQVCGALREAHAAGLVHRDVNPANVLVCERGGLRDVAKLLDFGLVRARGPGREGETLTEVGTIAGTPAYMSPEQARGSADVDARSDLYSVGAVAYFLLTGRPPFERETAVQTLAAHLGEAVVAPDRHGDVPADVQAVILRCLEKGPARRFQTADELEQALARCACAGWQPQPAGGQ